MVPLLFSVRELDDGSLADSFEETDWSSFLVEAYSVEYAGMTIFDHVDSG